MRGVQTTQKSCNSSSERIREEEREKGAEIIQNAFK